jgi:hypothetical protein
MPLTDIKIRNAKPFLDRAYNRTSFLKERRALMNCWGSYLDGLKNTSKLISLVKRTGSG